MRQQEEIDASAQQNMTTVRGRAALATKQRCQSDMNESQIKLKG
jgi:hypothetical protein